MPTPDRGERSAVAEDEAEAVGCVPRGVEGTDAAAADPADQPASRIRRRRAPGALLRQREHLGREERDIAVVARVVLDTALPEGREIAHPAVGALGAP